MPPARPPFPNPAFSRKAPIAWMLAACLLPGALLHLGVDFGFPWPPGAEGLRSLNAPSLHRALAGSIVHLLLEWSAVTTALLVGVVAYAHYRATRDTTTLALSIALLGSGLMDAFHALAAGYLINACAPHVEFISFTWAVGRMFNAWLMLACVGLVLLRKLGRTAILRTALVFLVAAVVAMAYARTALELPHTRGPSAITTRPLDVAALLGFLVAGVWAYPALHRRSPSFLSYSLILSVIPAALTQLHMAFGSERLFDANFNIAHGLKVVAYFIPFLGLTADYMRVNGERRGQEDPPAPSKTKVREPETVNAESWRPNRELDRFAYIVSHDLQAPARQVASFATLLRDEYRGRLDEDADQWLDVMLNRSLRMQELIQALLKFSRVSGASRPTERVSLADVVESAQKQLSGRIAEARATVLVSGLPEAFGDPAQLVQLFVNLIDNSLKYRSADAPHIALESRSSENHICLQYSDNGIGVAPQFRERVFGVFQRLHSEEVPGTGMGLPICRRIVEGHGGSIALIDGGAVGVRFEIRLPLRPAVSRARSDEEC